ncbi:carboxypeptidase M [Galdieria sulphuraria]|uniref:Carboxypeptidase M n=1 Tax=Galdieria sulphuraria TaxID=130081 RepID=M2WS91_GALSU|nr:carboxypeptidase M [Galdieria sulphuraria]EME26725.1 carboxypeptidase M [Galdieria sulphuraria]|eukprot:XP_005703245.1 carboxypeptidase M [Galdieria sulphuraria]
MESTESGPSIEYLSYDEIVKGLHDLQHQYPDVVRLYSSQDAFQLASVGRCGVQQEPCTIWIVELVNRTGKSPQQLAQLPEMLVSGELHGDEPIGTLSSYYFIKTLVEHSPRDPWLSMLLNTRMVTVIPMTNAVGYSHGVRGESEQGTDYLGMDPNRDFPFDQEPNNCMRTVAARTIYSLFHRHLFQILLTFHGGTNVLSYEWGDTKHCSSTLPCEPCPDSEIMHLIANKLQQVSGSAGDYETPYVIGDMGSQVYPVRGGLEDWAYGASWSDVSGYCLWSPSTATNISNRCIAYLIETSHNKHPSNSTLGYYDWPMIRERDGHIPRNIRLSLVAMELLKPFIYLIGWGEPLGRNVMNGGWNDRIMNSRWSERRPLNKDRMDEFLWVWWVGGGLVVHETWIQFATAKEDSISLHGSTMKQNNTSEWMDPFMNDTLSGYLFHDSINLTQLLLQVGKEHAIYFRGWLSMDRYEENVQSHWIQARNNDSWFGSIPGHVISGQSYYVSDCVRIEWKKNEDVYEISKVDADQLQWNRDEEYPTRLEKNLSIWSWLKWVLLAIVLGPGTFPLLGCIGVGCLRLFGIRMPRITIQRIWSHWISKRATTENNSSVYYPMQSSSSSSSPPEEEEEGLWNEKLVK